MALIDKLTNIADAIRGQTGKTEPLSLDDMATSIGNISGINFEVVGGTEQPKTGDILYWDGNTDGLDNLLNWYKVSDIVPSFEEITNGYILLLSNGAENTEKNVSPVQETGFISVCENLCLVIEEDNLSMPAGTFSSKGIYFYKDTNYFTASLKIKGFTGFEKENVKENTIWVNTDVDISSWIFSSSEPETPSDGMTWIYTGTTSPSAFNTLKKNVTMVYPSSAYQYVNGEWVGKTAKTYQNGEWIEWVLYLYNHGDQCTTATGGYTFMSNNSNAYTTPDVDGIKFYAYGQGDLAIARTNNEIDLSNISVLKLSFDGLYSQYTGCDFSLIVASNNITSAGETINELAKVTHSGNSITAATVELNVENVSKGYIYMYHKSNGKYNAFTLYVREIKGE